MTGREGRDGDAWRMLHTDAGEFPLPDDLGARAAAQGIEVVAMAGHDAAEIAARGASCDGLFLFRARVDDDLLAALPRCRLLARVGTGYDLIDVAAARARSVLVTYVPDFCSEEMSDHVLLLILAFARRLPLLVRAGHDHHWLSVAELPLPRRVAGRTLGILGFGHSARRTAEKARAFRMTVLVWNRTPRPDALARVGARAAAFEEVLGCDYVSIHLPLAPDTQGMIGREALRLMAPESVLINVGRGAVVDTAALVEALREGRPAGAGLDVVDPAPLPPAHPLWTLPNVLITSHTAGLSAEAFRHSFTAALADVVAVAHGRPPAHPIPECAERMPA